MNRRELRRKAFEIAAGLIDAMDLDKFWGEKLVNDNDHDDLEKFRTMVVRYLRAKEAYFNRE